MQPSATRGPRRRTAADDAGDASPARALQEELAHRLGDYPAERRWSPRATLTFVVVVCGAFWISAFTALGYLYR